MPAAAPVLDRPAARPRTPLPDRAAGWRIELAADLARRNPGLPAPDLDRVARATILRTLFLRLCEDRGAGPAGRRYPSSLFDPGRGVRIGDRALPDILRGLDPPAGCPALPADLLGQVHERLRPAPAARKAGGVYYTPAHLVEHIVRHTVGKLLAERTPEEASQLKVLDPACGGGAFLLGAYRHLLDWHLARYVEDGPARHRRRVLRDPAGAWRLTPGERRRILLDNIFGVDIDPEAVEVTRLSLMLLMLEGSPHDGRPLPDLAGNVRCGNALVGPDFPDARPNAFDWPAAFPGIMRAGGFDAVIGNPPWGQKEVAAEEGLKAYLWAAYPSSRGIFDLFRPFVEKAVTLTRPGGEFGMVLPDIVLLKDYPETRRLLLDRLTLRAIDWWGSAFADAVIDAATVIGTRAPAPPGHSVRVAVHDPRAPVAHPIPQSDFRENPRHVFNLHLTPEKRRALEALKAYPKLGDFFEVHEGVHSGNIRGELFVDRCVDASCRPLLFGRREIRPHTLSWHGRYIRLAAIPESRTADRYASAGRPGWYDREKVLVRRTGDRVLAAVDRDRRYASNNFFLVFPRRPCGLDLDGLCALLNSAFMTRYFRTVEPRRGQAFAELKIKHLAAFPLPADPEACAGLNRLGRERVRRGEVVDVEIDLAVRAAFPAAEL